MGTSFFVETINMDEYAYEIMVTVVFMTQLGCVGASQESYKANDSLTKRVQIS